MQGAKSGNSGSAVFDTVARVCGVTDESVSNSYLRMERWPRGGGTANGSLPKFIPMTVLPSTEMSGTKGPATLEKDAVKDDRVEWPPADDDRDHSVKVTTPAPASTLQVTCTHRRARGATHKNRPEMSGQLCLPSINGSNG